MNWLAAWPFSSMSARSARKTLALRTMLMGPYGALTSNVLSVSPPSRFPVPPCCPTKSQRRSPFRLAGEKVRADYFAPVPELADVPPAPGIRLAPIAHLLRMKLTSNRLKDMTHVRDLLDVGLITSEMEEG